MHSKDNIFLPLYNSRNASSTMKRFQSSAAVNVLPLLVHNFVWLFNKMHLFDTSALWENH